MGIENDENVMLFKQNAKSKSANPDMEYLKSNPDVLAGMSMENFRKEIALKLRSWREQAGLTQIELAELMRTSQKQVSRMESCIHTYNVTADMIARYALACGLSPTISATSIEPVVVDLTVTPQ